MSDGSILSVDDIAESLSQSFRGTSHSDLSNLFLSTAVNGKIIEIKFKNNIPNNMEALFSLPDFFIYPKNIFTSSRHSTGPYEVVEIDKNLVKLKLNKYYPSSLRANNVENVELHTIASGTMKDFFFGRDDNDHLMAYFIGCFTTKGDLDHMKRMNLLTNKYPNEWISLIGFNNLDVSLEDREVISSYVNRYRDEILKDSPLAQTAYSVSPQDRSYGLKVEDVGKEVDVADKLSRRITIGIRSRDKSERIVQNLINSLSNFDNIEFLFFEKSSDIYSKADAYFGAQGISAGDPIHHMNFFLKYEPLFKKIFTQGNLNKISSLKSINDFNTEIKKLEMIVYKNKAIIPIAHFPGVVVHSKNLKPDENLVGDWGIRAWTYQILR